MTRDWWRSGELLFAVGLEDTFITQTRDGERELDEYELTQHYDQWHADLGLMAESGASLTRWGIPWHRVNPQRGVWDWSWIDQIADRLEEVQVTPIIDLMHYGTPKWLEGEFLHKDYPQRVAEYSALVAERYRGRFACFTPVNEPMLNAIYCGQYGYWPPYAEGDTGLVSLISALSRGISLAQREIVDAVGDEATFVHVEASFPFEADAPEAEQEAAFLRERAFIIQDLVTGKVGPDHPLLGFLNRNGMDDAAIAWAAEHAVQPDVMGVNYYPAGQTEIVSIADPHHGGPGDFRPRRNAWTEGLEDVLDVFAERYERPVFLTETAFTGTEQERIDWLDASVATVRAMRKRGRDVVGYTWWSLIDMYEWNYRHDGGELDDYQLAMGLWQLVREPDGTLRRQRTELADRFRAHALGQIA
ncbi:family 1 glycosylhydrolase [Microbacterium sp. A84]|uniref:family 1 glycosylhydrolase n=1 Tax=Microbacterium sp. A84 TaxID=3450715 RepID=UPI003F42568C